MDFDDINPFSALLAAIGALGSFIVMNGIGGFGGIEGISIIWKILTPVVTFVVGFFYCEWFFNR